MASELSPAETVFEVDPEAQLEQTRAEVRKLERRDWWLWALAMVVMLLLTMAVLSMTFPGLITIDDPFFREGLDRAARGLTALVLLFNVYSIYQQRMIKNARRKLQEQLRLSEQLCRQAYTDPLTGLANRRTVEAHVSREMARSRRRKSPLTVVAFDLNNFKQINDRHGHAAGDAVLRAFAQRLMHRRRGEDLVVRMGGDEFLLVLPECPPEQVPPLLERLAPCEANFQGAVLPIEFSSGVATYQAPETLAQLLDRADQELYANKRAKKQKHLEQQPVVA